MKIKINYTNFKIIRKNINKFDNKKTILIQKKNTYNIIPILLKNRNKKRKRRRR